MYIYCIHTVKVLAKCSFDVSLPWPDSIEPRVISVCTGGMILHTCQVKLLQVILSVHVDMQASGLVRPVTCC